MPNRVRTSVRTSLDPTIFSWIYKSTSISCGLNNDSKVELL